MKEKRGMNFKTWYNGQHQHHLKYKRYGFWFFWVFLIIYQIIGSQTEDDYNKYFTGETIAEAKKWVVGTWSVSVDELGWGRFDNTYIIKADGTCINESYASLDGSSGVYKGVWSIIKNRDGEASFRINSEGCHLHYDFSKGASGFYEPIYGKIIKRATTP